MKALIPFLKTIAIGLTIDPRTSEQINRVIENKKYILTEHKFDEILNVISGSSSSLRNKWFYTWHLIHVNVLGVGCLFATVGKISLGC